MKKYLINPNQRWCKANLHCHTTNSDGNFTPEEIKKIYMEHGYDIVAYTDHDIIVDNSNLTDENFIAITSTEYGLNMGEVINNDYAGTPCVHINLFAKDPHNTFHPACTIDNIQPKQREKFAGKFTYDNFRRGNTPEALNEVIKRANDAGFLVQFNHPHWSLNERSHYINLKGLWSLEIYNYLTEIETGAEYCPGIYDEMVNAGQRLYCSMGDDNHNFNNSYEGSFGGFNYIGVDNFTYENVLSSMENGNFYCSSGPKINALYIEDDKIYVECDPAIDIIFTAKDRRYRHYYGENLTKADFKLFGGEEYFRITIWSKDGKRAHTHFYYVDEILKK